MYALELIGNPCCWGIALICCAPFRSANHGCCNASWALILNSGLNCNILCNRSIPEGSICGKIERRSCVAYIWKFCLYSVNCEIPGQLRSDGVPMIRKIRISWSSLVVPGNNGRPVYISAIMQPADQISMLVLYVREPSRTSGARYHNVTTSLENVLTGIPKARAKPKSASFSWPLTLMRRFCGLRSRCSTLLVWQKSIPSRSWCMNDLMVMGFNAPRSPCVSIYFLRSLSIYSKTSISLFSVWMTSCRLTMFSCFNSFMREISRMAVEGVPSSESRWISFNATSSPVCRFRPLKT